MKKILILSIVLFLVSNALLAQQPTDQLIGNWKIDLRPTPQSEAYFQFFVVETIDGNSFTGTFYGSEIKNALINTNWPKVYFAFSTSDQNNIYYHSGYIDNGELSGMTYCPGREFAAPWTGIKE